MYRPTVRCFENYKRYINKLFHVKTLDRNQILRLALHAAAHSEDFKRILSSYKSDDVSLPRPEWELDYMGLWFENRAEEKNVKQLETKLIKVREQGGIMIDFR